jgi:two-component system, NarL family, sensor kinase
VGATGVGAEPVWVVLTEAGGATGARPVARWRVFLQVGVIAALVIIAVVVSAVFAASRLAEDEAIRDASRTTDVLADGIVQPVLTDSLLAGDTAAVAALDTVIRNSVFSDSKLSDSVVRVKLWDSAGRILYSDEPRLIGSTYTLGEDDREALESTRTDAEVSDVQAPENRYEAAAGKLLEVYRAVWTPSGEAMLFEVYFRYDSVTARGWDLWRGFSLVTIGSIVLLLALLVPVLVRLLKVVRASQAHREALLQHALDASGDERRRIAGALHDGVVQELASTSYSIAGSALRASQLGDPGLSADLQLAESTVRGSIGGLRSLLVDIYPPSLAAEGLPAALDDLAASIRARGIVVVVDIDDYLDSGTRLDSEQERLVFRVAQECLRNAAKHSAASMVFLRLTRTGDDGVVLVIEDDGTGFDAPAKLALPEGGHFGLRVLADAVADAGGRLELRTAPGAGTAWRLTVTAA